MAGRSDHLDTDHVEGGRKNCRACTDFKSWIKHTSKKTSSSKPQHSSPGPEQSSSEPEHSCPLDKDELGRSGWGVLHSMAAYYPQRATEAQATDMQGLLGAFSRFYPCDFCAKDMRRDLKEEPPRTAGRDELSQWLCRLHNKVNAKLGKPAFDCARVDERWRDGWKDGSCG